MDIKILKKFKDDGMFLWSFINYETKECFDIYWQFTLKEPWLIPKFDPNFCNCGPLYGWLFFYFGRQTKGVLIEKKEDEIVEKKDENKIFKDKNGKEYFMYTINNNELSEKVRKEIKKGNYKIELENINGKKTLIFIK